MLPGPRCFPSSVPAAASRRISQSRKHVDRHDHRGRGTERAHAPDWQPVPGDLCLELSLPWPVSLSRHGFSLSTLLVHSLARDNGRVSELPRRAAMRTVKLAALPLGLAGRTAMGLGRRVGGRSAELVAAEVQARTADQLFKVLGELKGGAMKFGQALSIFEAAMPEDLAGPYRATLTKLQDAAPPMPASIVHAVLIAELGPRWRQKFLSFDDKPAAAASIGQVHRAVWKDGRHVAVKLQYPGAGQALISDLNQVSRVARLAAVWIPGLDIKPILDELKSRVAEELDYGLEAKSQKAFAAAFAGDPEFAIPDVVHHKGNVIVSEWLDGTPLSTIIATGSQKDRDAAALLAFLGPFMEPLRTDTFTFSRAWLRSMTLHLNDPRRPDFMMGFKLNLPPSYLLIHRVWLGGIGVLCQIQGEVPGRAILDGWLPGADLPPFDLLPSQT